MKTEEHRTESLEEIVFRHRNKSYGAYQLRRDYRKFVIIAMVFALFITSAVVSYPLVTAIYYKPTPPKDEEKVVGVNILNPPAEEKPKPEVPEAPEPEVAKVRFVAPVLVDSAGDPEFGKQDLLAERKNTEIPDEYPMITVIEEKPPVIEQPKEAAIFTVVEENPQFPGGYSELNKYLGDAINYPEEAKELGIQGRVFVTFVVETNGSVSNVKVLRGIGGGCDEEAIRVVQGMPKWTPGKQRGIPVRVSFNLPIKFTLRTD